MGIPYLPGVSKSQARKRKISLLLILQEAGRGEKGQETGATEISTPAHCSRTRPFIPISRGHQISDIPQLDGEVPNMESKISESCKMIQCQ
jgi:hypothetical protein